MERIVVQQAYRFALDPTPAQVRNLERHAGAARFAFNWALAQVQANIGQRAAERTYDVPEEDLTPFLGWNLPALRRAWNRTKNEVAPWWAECSKEAYNTGLERLARALKNWVDTRSGIRNGRRVGFPRFKSRRRSRPSVRFTTGVIRLEEDRKHITLPRIGAIKTHESTRKLARRLEAGIARILSATVRLEGGRWFCALTIEVHRTIDQPVRPDVVVGVDLGISNLAVLSTGECVPNPRYLDKSLRKLRSASRTLSRRRGPDRRTHQLSSRRWERARRRLERLHARVTNLRRDGLHKLTTSVAGGFGIVVVEDLNVLGMMRNRHLARQVADTGFAEIRRQLVYKTVWMGGQLVVADRWYPSSKTCSACGAVKPKLRLADRVYNCPRCGLVLDRDLNAARNLKQSVARSGRETLNGRGADRKTGPHPAGGVEASTLPRVCGQVGDRSPATVSCEWERSARYGMQDR